MFSPLDKLPSFSIKDVSLEDEGIYRCRVDWKSSPTVNTIVNLTLIGEIFVPTVSWTGRPAAAFVA